MPTRYLLGLTLGLSVTSLCTATPAVSAPSTPPAATATGPEIAETELVSVTTDGKASRQGDSVTSAVSGDGRYVAFTSAAKRLAPGTGSTHDDVHVYLRDLDTDVTSAVDVRPDGRFGNGGASTYSGYNIDISADGRFVVFSSQANNLTPGGSLHRFDIFLRDVVAGTTTLVCHAPDGAPADDNCVDPQISADATTIVFQSHAKNLVAGDTHKSDHIYRYDVATDQIALVSKTPDGAFANENSISPSVSGDGGLIAYSTKASDIVPGGGFFYDAVLYDVASDTTRLVSRRKDGPRPDGESFATDISAGGATVVFGSDAYNLVAHDTAGYDVFRFDVTTGDIRLVSTTPAGRSTNGDSYGGAVTDDGSHIAYMSRATNVVKDDDNKHDDVFLLDVATGQTTLVSHNASGAAANGDSGTEAIAGDGSLVTYNSSATDLVDITSSHRMRVYATPGRGT